MAGFLKTVLYFHPSGQGGNKICLLVDFIKMIE